jgi:DNA-directed RNA polymerase specialized sigma subunit
MGAVVNMSNDGIMPKAKDGDSTAIEQLYMQNAGMIHIICNSLSQTHPQERDDLSQEAYFAL